MAAQQNADADTGGPSSGYKPDPDSWVRPSLKHDPIMKAWLGLMTEVGSDFPVPKGNKELGISAKLAYTDSIMRFTKWLDSKPGGTSAISARLAATKLMDVPQHIDAGLNDDEKAQAAGPLPDYLTILRVPSLPHVLEFLDHQYVAAPGAEKPRFAQVRHALHAHANRHNKFEIYQICLLQILTHSSLTIMILRSN